MRATGSRSDAMGPFFGGHDGHERCLEVAYNVPSSEPHSRPKPWPGTAAAAPTPACLRSTDRTLWGSAGGVLYLLARVGSWAIDLVPSRHPYVARRARERRLCQEWGAQTGPAGADSRIRASEESIATKAQKQASPSSSTSRRSSSGQGSCTTRRHHDDELRHGTTTAVRRPTL